MSKVIVWIKFSFLGEFERVPASEEDDARDEQQSLDSGNEEPTDPDLVEESSGEMGDERPSYMGNGINSRGRSRDFVVTNSSLEHVNPGELSQTTNNFHFTVQNLNFLTI